MARVREAGGWHTALSSDKAASRWHRRLAAEKGLHTESTSPSRIPTSASKLPSMYSLTNLRLLLCVTISLTSGISFCTVSIIAVPVGSGHFSCCRGLDCPHHRPSSFTAPRTHLGYYTGRVTAQWQVWSACPPPRGPPAGRWSPRGWQRPVWLSCFYLHCQVRPSWLPALPWGGRGWEGPVAREEQQEPSTSAPCATGTSCRLGPPQEA